MNQKTVSIRCDKISVETLKELRIFQAKKIGEEGRKIKASITDGLAITEWAYRKKREREKED